MYRIWIGIMGYYGQPKNLLEFSLYNKQIGQLKKWLGDIRTNKDNGQRTAFLIGPSGTGKTTLVNNLFADFGYDMVEFSPDPSNTHKVEMERLNSILSAGNVMMMIGGKKKGVLFDDIEVGATSERGFLNDVLSIAEKRVGVKGNPVIFTLNSAIKSKRLAGIEKHSLCVHLYRPSSYEIFNVGRKVCQRLTLKLEDHRIQYLANRCQGDLRKLHDAIQLIIKENEVQTTPSQSDEIKSQTISQAMNLTLRTKSNPITVDQGINETALNSFLPSVFKTDYPKMPDPTTLAQITILGKQYYYQATTKHCWDVDKHKYLGIWNPVTPPALSLESTSNKTHYLGNSQLETCENVPDTVELDTPENTSKEVWNVLALKDLRFSPLKSIEKYLLPTNQVDNYVFDSIFHSDPLFAPANVYENSWPVLKNIRFKTEKERLDLYQNILSSLCDWATFESSYIEPFSYVLSDYSAMAGITKPMVIMREARRITPYATVPLKTSNIYSRISQASFNWRSMSELSSTLDISRTEFHDFSYIIAKTLADGKNGVMELGTYLQKRGIISNDLDRIIRYNCISPQLDKLFPSKKRTSVRKILNGRSKKTKETTSTRTKGKTKGKGKGKGNKQKA